MAIVKANYVKRGREAKNRAKATIRYNQQRPGEQGAKLTRELFGADGPLTRDEVLRMIDEAAKGALFYRIVISPDPLKEDSGRDMDMKELTLQAMANLEERLKTKVFYAAAVHADHAPHRHVHVLAILSSKLRQSDLNSLRQAATRISLLQRRIRDLTAERSLAAKHKLKLKPSLAKKPIRRGVSPEKGSTGASLAPVNKEVACPRGCGGYTQKMERISSKIQRCESCGIVLRMVGFEYQIEQRGFSLGLSH
jgi:hypothetical protein